MKRKRNERCVLASLQSLYNQYMDFPLIIDVDSSTEYSLCSYGYMFGADRVIRDLSKGELYSLWPRNTGNRYGWLSLEGKHWLAPSAQHTLAASHICEFLGYSFSRDWHDDGMQADEVLEGLGWLHCWSDEPYIRYPSKLTNTQADWIYDSYGKAVYERVMRKVNGEDDES